MSEKKVVSRNVAIALGITCVIIAAGLVGAVANYMSIINKKDNIIATKDSQIQTLTSQKNQLQTWLNENLTLINTLNAQITNMQNQISNLNSQITSLENQINALKAPKLTGVDLNGEDNRPFLATPYLHVHGYICNMGTNTAYNSRIHVVAYQSGGVTAIDTYITLGIISGQSCKSIDSKVYYSGSALTSWSLPLEWTDTP